FRKLRSRRKTTMKGERSVAVLRKEFPVTTRYIYLDHAGIAPLPRRVTDAVEDFLADSSRSGAFSLDRWASRVTAVREMCARLIHADPHEVAFVRNTSHGLSLIAQGLDWKHGDNLLVYEKEFPANIYPWLALREKGVEIRFIPSRNGTIHPDDIAKLISERTRLVTLSSVQFSNGFRIDLDTVGDLCASKGVFLCIDAIQSLGVIPMDVKKHHIDFLSADGHKWLLAPEGTGIFYCNRDLVDRIYPPLLGWKSVEQEFDFDQIDLRLKTSALRFEEGSLNTMGIVALGAALDLLFEVGIETIEEAVLGLGDLIISLAKKRGFILRSPKDHASRGGIVSFRGDFDPRAVCTRLRSQGVMVNVRDNALRISPHFYNREDEVVRLFDLLP
ncbi:MAG: aminotransferase class V-fold PLP-dependent enzyme, partial [Deltaproteobacteria bacterium]|nr:aminotransferase class V-fold PLP-dependent enzyme [Deltaproteobacteria bacterium]